MILLASPGPAVNPHEMPLALAEDPTGIRGAWQLFGGAYAFQEGFDDREQTSPKNKNLWRATKSDPEAQARQRDSDKAIRAETCCVPGNQLPLQGLLAVFQFVEHGVGVARMVETYAFDLCV